MYSTLAANAPVIWYAGLIVVNQQSADVGGASAPDPEDDEADWMWYRTGFHLPGFRDDDAGTGLLHEMTPRYMEIDNKSARKLNENNKTLLYVFKNDASSGQIISQAISLRMLLKLH